MRELVCNGQLWERGALKQLPSYKVGFSSNSLVNTMEMMAVIQYILKAAQSSGSQDYYIKSRIMMILKLAGVFFCENEQAQIKWIIVCSEENTRLDA